MSEFLTVDQIMRDDMLRDYFTTNPKKVDPASTAYTYYVDTLFRKAQSVYKFNGMPDNWETDVIFVRDGKGNMIKIEVPVEEDESYVSND